MGRVIKTAVISAVVVGAVVATGGALGFGPAAGILAGGTATATAVTATLSAAAMAGLGMLTSKGIEATRDNFGTKVSARGASNPRLLIYGECRVGGTITQMQTVGTNNTKLCMFVAVAGHIVNKIVRVRFNDTIITHSETIANDTTINATNSAFINTNNDNNMGSGRLVRFVAFDGSQTARCTLAASTLGSSFVPTTHKFINVAYVYFELIFDNEKLNAIPNISFDVQGKKVFDPRDSSTSFSSNPALCIRDYLTDTVYGLKALSTEINDTTAGGGFAAAANTCDVDANPISGGSVEDAYTCNGFTNFSASGEGVIEGLLSSCAGKLTYTNGQFNLFPQANQTPSLTVTDDDILEPITLVTAPETGATYNQVKTVFPDSTQAFKTQDTPVFTDSTFLTSDTPSGGSEANFRKMLELQTPFTTTHTASQRLGRIALKLSRKKQTISILVGLNFLKVQPQDWIYVTNERFGFDQKTFQVMSVELSPIGDRDNPTLAVRITAREIDNTITPFLTADYTDPEDPASDLSLDHSEFVGNQSIIDDNISLFGTNSVSSVTISGTTSIITATVNFTGLSSGNIMINLFFIPLMQNQVEVRREPVAIKLLRGSTTVFNETMTFIHENTGSGLNTLAKVSSTPYVNILHVDTNVSAGSYTYTAQVGAGIERVDSIKLAVTVFTK